MGLASISVWGSQRPSDMAAHYAIRHDVFVNEQGVLLMTDVDQWDSQPGVVHALAANGNTCAGTVRLYPMGDQGLWKGDRLAVVRSQRTTAVGAQLVRFATATARSRGGLVMIASVQLPNVRFFERLGWTRDGEPKDFYGLPHQPMRFDLTTAPPLSWMGRPDGLTFDGVAAERETALCPAA